MNIGRFANLSKKFISQPLDFQNRSAICFGHDHGWAKAKIAWWFGLFEFTLMKIVATLCRCKNAWNGTSVYILPMHLSSSGVMCDAVVFVGFRCHRTRNLMQICLTSWSWASDVIEQEIDRELYRFVVSSGHGHTARAIPCTHPYTR